MVQKLLKQWVETHHVDHRTVTLYNLIAQPAFCRFLDLTPKLAYVRFLAKTGPANILG